MEEIWFMPWAGLGELKIGPVAFWPFSRMAGGKVRDQQVRERLERYFQRYVDHAGSPVDTVTVCSHDSANLESLEPDAAKEVRAAADALIFSIICPATKAGVCADNRTMAPPSADRYQLLRRNPFPDDDHISVASGRSLHICRIDDVAFQQPWWLGGGFGVPNARLTAAFDKSFGVLGRERTRLFQSLEWFRLAHTQYDQVSEASKVVMMATAFEILLGAGKSRKKKEWIVCELERRCARPDSHRDGRKTRDGNRIYSKVACWGWDFYELRNAIAHGDEVTPEQLKYPTPSRPWLMHLIVADLVFWECVTRELYRLECIGEVKNHARELAGLYKPVFPDMQPDSFVDHVATSLLGFGDVHRALGWSYSQQSRA
jgi:hypothetical protein